MRAYTRFDDRADPPPRLDRRSPTSSSCSSRRSLHDAGRRRGPRPGRVRARQRRARRPSSTASRRCVPAGRLAPAPARLREPRHARRARGRARRAAARRACSEAAVETLGRRPTPTTSATRVAEGYARWAMRLTSLARALPIGGAVVRDEAAQPHTGGWRTGLQPAVDLSLCVDCLLCWLYCPDSAIALDGDDVRRLRPRPLQGLRDLRRRLPDRRDRDGAR